MKTLVAKYLALSCALAGLVTQAQAADLPTWVDQPPAPDLRYHYYVGRSGPQKSDGDAYREATQDAMEVAISENFGVVTSVQLSGYASITHQDLDKRVVETSSKVHLDGFERTNSFVARNDGLTTAYLLFRYSNTAIEKERNRLAAGKPAEQAPVSEIGQQGTGTSLKVDSQPQGAEIYIDGDRWGITPTVINGALESGEHDLRIQHAQFNDVQEKIHLAVQSPAKVFKILLPATGQLSVRTRPSKATIYVNGKREGVSPLKIDHVPAGKPVLVEAVFDSKNALSRTMVLIKDEEQIVKFDLPLPVEGRTRVPASLTATSPVRVPVQVPEPVPVGANSSQWVFGLHLGVTSGNVPQPYSENITTLGFSVEKRFAGHFGLKAQIGGDQGSPRSQTNSDGTQSTSSGQADLTGSSFGVGVPLFLSDARSTAYLMPEFGSINYDYAPQKPVMYSGDHKWGTLPIEQRQNFLFTRKGVTLGYQDSDSHYDLYASYYSYDWGPLGKHDVYLIGIGWIWGN